MVCGTALARMMQRAFISPISSPEVRKRARATLDLLARRPEAIVCGRRNTWP